jgi:hypothetical protein
MNAEDFYKMFKKGKRMENEYFIAVDKATLFEMMEAYAEMKIRHKNKDSIKKPSGKKILDVLEHN